MGLSPEDLVPRSSLFVPPARLSDPGSPAPSMPSLSGVPRASRPPDLDTLAAATPVHSAAHAAEAAPTQKTKLWSAPEGATEGTPAARSVAPSAPLPAHGFPPPQASRPSVPSRSPSPSPSPAVAATPGVPAYASNVDRTLDDSSPVRAPSAPPAPGPSSAPRIRTEPALLPPVGLNLPPPPPPAVRGVASTIGSGMQHTVIHSSRGDEPESERKEPVPTRRLVAVVVICLLVGVLGASVVLYQLGILGGTGHDGSLDDVVAHADEALKHGRWDTPPGDNVRDITTDGLTRWPREPRLVEVRARATDELVKEAVGLKFAGDLPAALHMARLAKELDPTDTTAQHLVDDYEHATPAVATDAGSTRGAPTPIASAPRGATTHPPPGIPAGPNAPRVVLDASLPRPRVGQPITFTAKVAGPAGPAKSVEDARFVINGPGLSADTKLGVLAGANGTYSAQFTGFEPGKHDVTFDAKVDGTAVRLTKAVVIEGDARDVPGPPPSSSAATVPPPGPRGKWL